MLPRYMYALMVELELKRPMNMIFGLRPSYRFHLKNLKPKVVFPCLLTIFGRLKCS